MSKADEVKLFSDFYECNCGHLEYRAQEALLRDARCPGCRQKNVFHRLEIYRVLNLLRSSRERVENDIVPPPPIIDDEVPPPVFSDIPAPPPPRIQQQLFS